MTRYRPTFVEIDLDAVAHNVRLLRPAGAELMAVVKADGYGHGDAEVAVAALGAGASRLGVALVEEGLRLRERGIDAPILVLAEFPPGSEKEALERGLTPTVYTDEGLAGVAEAARALGRPVGVHLKVDTGMHRVGLWPPEGAPAFARRILEAGLELEGLWTHFADSERDDAGTLEQLARFLATAEALGEARIAPGVLHAANSGATIRFPQTHLDLVRPGAAVYGVDPGGGLAEPFGVRPALSWRSAVTMVKRLPAGERVSYGGRYALERDATIATVPVGYDDGYPQAARGEGRRPDRGPATSGRRDDHDGPDPRGLRGRLRGSGRRGRADRRPGRRTHPGRGARRARRHDRAPDHDRDRRARPTRVRRRGGATAMSRKRTALVTAGIAAGAVAGGVIGRTVLNSRRRPDPEADEHLSELPPEDLGPVRSFDGTELAVRAAGDPSKPTIVFVHGFSLDMTTWHYQWTGLSDRYRCVLFDFRSHGGSARAAGGDLSPLAFGHDLAAVLRAVGDKPVLLVGHSMGAMSILAMAETQPELFGDPVAGVVFVGSAASDLVRGAFGSVTELLRPRLGSLRQAAGRVNRLRRYVLSSPADVAQLIARATQFGPDASPHLVRYVVGLAAKAPSEVWTDGLAGLMELDLRHAVQHIAVPAMVLVGEQDRMTPPASSVALAGELPKGRLEVIPGAGHFPMMEAHEEFNRRLASFAAEVLRPRRQPAQERMSGLEVPA